MYTFPSFVISDKNLNKKQKPTLPFYFKFINLREKSRTLLLLNPFSDPFL